MDITFDISKDELPIFLAEVDEHLQMLDNNLLRLEGEAADAELIQTVFRSAHTIKGMAGMIGHRRMTEVTHALESVLDGVRKNSIDISTSLIQQCLEVVDCLRELREEVATSTVSEIDVEELVYSLKEFVEGRMLTAMPAIKDMVAPQVDSEPPCHKTLQIQARIDANSMASAARAFQLMMALQDLGEIQAMKPTQAEIETALAVATFEASLISDQPFEKVCEVLTRINGVDEITLNGKTIVQHGDPVSGQVKDQDQAAQSQVQKEASANSQMPERRSPDPNGRRITDLTLRMNIEHLDVLMNLVGELITDRNHLQQLRGQVAMEANFNGYVDELNETVTHLGRVTDQLQEEVMGIRMLPISSMFNKFPRMIHDMARKVGKEVKLVVRGEDTEMDRSMIDEIYDPLIHLIRNCVDHGIEAPADRRASGKLEAGTVTLTARHEQGRIIVSVEDDGRGIDGEKLRQKALQKGLISAEESATFTPDQCIDLMFMAGLSTVEQATEFSGRGVGLDIVKTNIQHVNGTIDVESHAGVGTKFVISLPLTLAIIPALLVRVKQSTFAIPMIMITETLRLRDTDIKRVNRKPVTLLRGKVLPLIALADVFNLTQANQPHKYLFAVVIQVGKQQVGLLVDSLIGEEEVVVKPLGSFVGDLPGISSATILGNGQVALIVDVYNLFKLIGM